MQRRPNIDMQSALNDAVQMQIACMDLTVSYWRTVFGQAVDWAEMAAKCAQELERDEPDLAANVRRVADFGARSANEFGKLAARSNRVLLNTLDGMRRPGGSAGRQR